jgi:hypothetical protein
MPQDFHALFAPDAVAPPASRGPDFRLLFAPDEDKPSFGSGTKKRMAEYEGLSPEEASAKYRAGWADTLSNAYDTVTDSRKLASAAGSAVKAGAHAVRHPIDTAQKIGDYYYENPDAAVTDAAFAAFPVKYGAKALGGVTKREAASSTAMPRAAVREGEELLSTGGKRMEEAKLNPSRVDADAIAGPLAEFREATKTVGLESPLVKAIAKKLEKAYTPRKRSPEYGMTGVEPKPRPPVKLNDLHGYEQALNKFINGAGKTEGRINSQGYEAIELKNAIDKMINDHPESGTFKIGKHEYHRGKMAQTFDQIYKDASLTSQWRNGNEILALQNATAQFLKARKNRYAFTPQIRAQMERFSRDNKGRLLSAFGSKTVSGNAAGRLVESAFGVPGALVLPGLAARESRTKRLMEAWKRIGEEIRAGGPVRD